ncbi:MULTISPECIES: ABC transporter permease [Pseudoalteromonas]|uniref:ABC transporter permease n=1 Tax=Pseudoalteromonas TaxID=53246 RepID=UPI00031FA3F0|nr:MULTISPECIES: ABC transporter permease [Pseudoalteromonas]MCF6145591.1 hypothetical protein [Pseudoalteromonas mariniglutinosa NCIMB 1770]
MLVNYFKTAIGAAKRQPLIYSLNLFSLSVGLVAVFFMALYINYEFSYDQQWQDSEHVYRVELHNNQQGTHSAFVNALLAKSFESISNIESVQKLAPMDYWFWFEQQVSINNKSFKLTKTIAATQNITDIFSFTMLHGELSTALRKPNSIVLSKSEAIRLFGESNVVGKRLQRDADTLIVTAVFADLAQNTHLDFRSIVPLSERYLGYIREYHDDSFVYVKLNASAQINVIEQALSQLMNQRKLAKEPQLTVKLNHISNIHLQGAGTEEMKAGGAIESVLICIAVCVVLLLVLAINFINMSAAALSKRGREIGIKKALGVTWGQLLGQFSVESFLLVAFTILLSVGVCEQLLPWFSDLVGRPLSISQAWWQIAIIAFFTLFFGMLLTAYSVFIVAKKPITYLLSGSMSSGRKASKFKSTLIILQTSCAIVLIIGAVNLNKQLDFLQNLPVGYDSQNRLYIPNIDRSAFEPQSSLLARINTLPDVDSATFVDSDLTKEMPISMPISWVNKRNNEASVHFSGVGYQAAQVLGLSLIAGRDFSAEFGGDWYHKVTKVEADKSYAASVIVTRSLVAQMGIESAELAIGHSFTSVDSGRLNTFTIIGVVNNVKIGNVRQSTKPLFFACGLSWMGKVAIQTRLKPAASYAVKAEINQLITKKLAMAELAIENLADNYGAIYQQEQFLGRVINLFTGLSILLSCIGVFALAAYGVRSRQKETSIRKVLGASRLGLINLFAREYLYLVLVSTVVALPIAYLFVTDWLANFNERVDQSLWVYLIAALSVAAITWLTVASLAFKAASTRPSLILRDE